MTDPSTHDHPARTIAKAVAASPRAGGCANRERDRDATRASILA
jgi:hypothetical protein